MRRVVVVMGTRPEAIKLCPVIERLRRTAPQVQTHIVVTHQHRTMLDQVLEVFGLRPDFDLQIMRDNQSLNEIAWRLLHELDPLLERLRPDLVLVQGDTSSAFVAGLAAYYRRTPVAHVEAGLRTGDPYSPYPEEMNRRLLGAVATLHFAPTPSAVGNLEREGVPAERIHVTGNTVVDALQAILAREPPANLAEFGRDRRLLLVTAHRRENFGQPLRDICRALDVLIARNPDVEVVYPVHLNPSVRATVFEMLGRKPRIHLLDPLDYLSFVHLMNRSTMILTDSGGIQEEAPSLGKPVLVLRRETERPELLEAGVGELVGTDSAVIVEAAQRLLDDPEHYRLRARVDHVFGDGRASERIVAVLLEHFSRSQGRPAGHEPLVPNPSPR
ncbi:MAG: non-hydrolyzing UDP-N-acetylglucosamine 2-epimerase [Candidatus Rokuibacteriota bacterium]